MKELTNEQIKEAESILKFYKSKDKEIKKMAKKLYINFLESVNLSDVFIKFRYIWDNYSSVKSYGEYYLTCIRNLSPSISLFLITKNKEYLPSNCKVTKKHLTICNFRQYLLDEFYSKKDS